MEQWLKGKLRLGCPFSMQVIVWDLGTIVMCIHQEIELWVVCVCTYIYIYRYDLISPNKWTINQQKANKNIDNNKKLKSKLSHSPSPLLIRLAPSLPIQQSSEHDEYDTPIKLI